MKKIALVILIAVLSGCSGFLVPKKPFIIVYKYPQSGQCGDGYCKFEYIDAEGVKRAFCEVETMYYIGDTIR